MVGHNRINKEKMQVSTIGMLHSTVFNWNVHLLCGLQSPQFLLYLLIGWNEAAAAGSNLLAFTLGWKPIIGSSLLTHF